MIDYAIMAIVFTGVTGGLFLGFQSLNDATGLYEAFQKKEQTAQLIILGVCAVISGGVTYMVKLKV